MQTRERVMKKIILISLLMFFVGCNSKWSDEDKKACLKKTKKRNRYASDKAIECHCDWLERRFDNWSLVVKIDGERENIDYCIEKYPEFK